MPKIPTPCIGICKFRREDHCVGCSMTRAQKSIFKTLKKDKQRSGFIQLVVAQQEKMGKFGHWERIYARKCRKKDVPNPVA